MADSFGKKEREKKKARKKKEKEQRKEERRSEGKQTEVFMYVDAYGNFTETKPEAVETDADDILELSGQQKSEGRKYKGSVKFVDQEKGYGFIKASGKLGDVYFNLIENKTPPTQGQRVEFDVEKSERGFKAINLKY